MGAKRTSQRVSMEATPGREILTVPIPVADTDMFPTPVMWHGTICDNQWGWRCGQGVQGDQVDIGLVDPSEGM